SRFRRVGSRRAPVRWQLAARCHRLEEVLQVRDRLLVHVGLVERVVEPCSKRAAGQLVADASAFAQSPDGEAGLGPPAVALPESALNKREYAEPRGTETGAARQ